MMMKVLLIAAGGACGTLARVGLSSVAQQVAGDRFPWGTIAVNLIGCFLFGLVWAITEDRVKLATELRWLLLAGFMGAFTTFSTFMFDNEQLVSASRIGAALGNMTLQNVAGILLMFAGLALGRAL